MSDPDDSLDDVYGSDMRPHHQTTEIARLRAQRDKAVAALHQIVDMYPDAVVNTGERRIARRALAEIEEQDHEPG